MLEDGVLTVQGDQGNDNVRIIADGDELTISSRGQSEDFDLADVEQIDVRLDGGNDNVTIDLSDADADELALGSIDVRTGAGTDTATIKLGEVAEDTDLEVTANLG